MGCQRGDISSARGTSCYLIAGVSRCGGMPQKGARFDTGRLFRMMSFRDAQVLGIF